ncbi:FMN-dependent NADH-azoreductase [Metamycoplasma neophronis]|uniref:FMN dependent NADH:quinone oxidoreductase n=1 Tax=Metamycoplasma neophronis TaxID=872983 RepID=A0ABY2YZ94_9BACT|nr:FMN-dependent NADH-azoreductase [Metamycoplasma neophronis]TPR53356.1 FMN-dependent NADH-azoreductase [Metamycoplasma neophronis]
MKKILVLYGSPMPRETSISTILMDYFVKEYQESHPEDEIISLDLNMEPMSTLPLTSANLGSFYNEELSDKYINLLKSVDKVIMNAPMINFNVPATVKNFFDRISVANKTFSYKYAKNGSSIGLLDHLKIQIIATQGAPLGWYPWASHVNYLEGIWNFLGAKVNPTVLLDGVKAEPLNTKSKQELLELKKNELASLAKEF